MGIQQIMFKVKHTLAANRILGKCCSVLFFSKTIDTIVDTTISITTAMPKSQNRIMAGAFSIKSTSLMLIFQIYFSVLYQIFVLSSTSGKSDEDLFGHN